jgi:hypothetical protein
LLWPEGAIPVPDRRWKRGEIELRVAAVDGGGSADAIVLSAGPRGAVFQPGSSPAIPGLVSCNGVRG